MEVFIWLISWYLFLKDLYKMENTCVCLNIIKIEPNFLSLIYHDSIATSQMHAHTFIEKKLQHCEILTRFWETFCGVLKGVCCVFFSFGFVQLFWPFYRRVRLFGRSVHAFMLPWSSGEGRVLLTPTRRFNQSKTLFHFEFQKDSINLC